MKHRSPVGLHLTSGDDEVLIPPREAPDELRTGDAVRVFVYRDNEGRALGSVKEPNAQLGDLVALKVVDVTDHGAFLDWGLPKDLFCPATRQHLRMQVGDTVMVKVLLDEKTNRLYAESRLGKHLDWKTERYQPGQAVACRVYGVLPLGAQVVVDGKHPGMIYATDLDHRPRVGDELAGWVVRVREDHRIDVSPRPVGREGRFDDTVTIVQALMAHDGFLPLHDKSDPDEIRRVVGLSKKAFKRAVGGLYRRRRITMEDGGIRLVED